MFSLRSRLAWAKLQCIHSCWDSGELVSGGPVWRLLSQKCSDLEPTERLRLWASASCCLFFLNSPRLSLCGASVSELHFLMFWETQAYATFEACQAPPPTCPHIVCDGQMHSETPTSFGFVWSSPVKELTRVAGWLAHCSQNSGN